MRKMVNKIIRDAVRKIPLLNKLIKSSDAILLGYVAGLFSNRQYEECLEYAYHGLSEFASKDHFVWWEFLRISVECGKKINKTSDYELLKNYALRGPKPIEGRKIAVTMLQLSKWGYDAGDFKGSIEFARMASVADENWGDPDFVIGWYLLPKQESIFYFKSAIKKDSELRNTILNNSTCKRYPEIIADL